MLITYYKYCQVMWQLPVNIGLVLSLQITMNQAWEMQNYMFPLNVIIPQLKTNDQKNISIAECK